MITEVKGTKYTCDGCGKSVVVYDQEEPAGFYGAVRQVCDMGGSATEGWYACKESCIRKAVDAATIRSWKL